MGRGLMAPALVVLAAGMARRYGGVKPLAPIGPQGEAVIDLLVADAMRAGFGRVVLVLNPQTGPAIRYHVERTWPSEIEVAFTTQALPLGTVHAVLPAHAALSDTESFAVTNADDVYGEASMRMLVDHLDSPVEEHVMVAYRVGVTVATDDPVTRGIAAVSPEGLLADLTERRFVTRLDDGARFEARDGREPLELAPDQPASVNLWGFRPAIWDVLEHAFAASGLDEEAMLAEVAAGGEIPKVEVLLPEVVAEMVRSQSGLPVRVLTTERTLIGVTHAADLPVVSGELARQVATGERPAQLWG